MSTRPRLSLSLCLLLAASACKGGEAVSVQEICEVTLSCSCTVPAYASVEACVADYDAEEERHRSLAAANGVTYNEGCFDVLLGVIQEVGCATDYDDDIDLCSEGCSLIHGDKPVGAACTQFGDAEEFSDCGNRLLCAEGTCVDLCNRLSAGAACVDAEFSPLGQCGDDLYCDFFGSLKCEPLSGVGGPCGAIGGCKDGLVCGAADTCEALPGAGETCDFECAGDLVCNEASLCATPPGEGEACVFECAPGLECDDNNVCVASEPLLCEPVFGN
jgi:hypothetical protein